MAFVFALLRIPYEEDQAGACLVVLALELSGSDLMIIESPQIAFSSFDNIFP